MCVRAWVGARSQAKLTPSALDSIPDKWNPAGPLIPTDSVNLEGLKSLSSALALWF